ncbi:hypothetical protein ACFQE7_26045 [Nonomuraea ferruginea]
MTATIGLASQSARLMPSTSFWSPNVASPVAGSHVVMVLPT